VLHVAHGIQQDCLADAGTHEHEEHAQAVDPIGERDAGVPGAQRRLERLALAHLGQERARRDQRGESERNGEPTLRYAR